VFFDVAARAGTNDILPPVVTAFASPHIARSIERIADRHLSEGVDGAVFVLGGSRSSILDNREGFVRHLASPYDWVSLELSLRVTQTQVNS
jgi:hypothetical protein